MSLNTTVFIVYVLIVFLFTYYHRIKQKRPDSENFLVGNRNLGIFEVAFSSVAGTFTAAGVLFAFGVAIAFGFPGYGIMIAFFLSPLILGLFAPYFYQIFREKKLHTLSDLIRERFGIYSEKIYATITVLFMFGWMIASFNINIALLERFLNINSLLASIISFSIVIIYLNMGGFKSIIKTDKLQFFVMILFSFVLILFIKNPVPVSETIRISEWFSGAFWIFAPVFFWANIANTAAWQPIIAAKDKKTARNGAFLSVLLGFLFYGPIIWLSSTFARDLPGIDPNVALFEGIGVLFPSFLTPLLFIALYAAMMSTLDTSLFYTASNTVKNLIPKKFIKSMDEVSLIRLFLVLFTVVAISFSFLIEGFVEFTIAVFPIIGITAFPLYFSLFTKLPDKVTSLVMLAGLISFIYIFLFPPENFLWNMFPALLTGLGIVIIFLHKSFRSHNLDKKKLDLIVDA